MPPPQFAAMKMPSHKPLALLAALALAAPTAADQHRRLRNGNPFDPPAGTHGAAARAPASQGQNGKPLLSADMLPRTPVPPVDRAAVAIEDAAREAAGKPPRFAVANEVDVDPSQGDGVWEDLDDGARVWRHRIKSPGCNSMNFGFCQYEMPKYGRMFIYDTKRPDVSMGRPFTSADNGLDALWTPVLEACDVTLEVNLDSKTNPEDLRLRLCSANVGYRGFHTRPEPHHPDRRELSGSCNVDVACHDQPNGWKDEIPSVAVMMIDGSLSCTGFMVNNVNQDYKPYFITANHCDVVASNAASVVVYWNYETSSCGGTPDGALTDWQTGAMWRAAYGPSDFTLIELKELPDPRWGVTYAGWDRSGADASSAVAIHHPNVDEKRISFENDATTTTDYASKKVKADGDHVRVEDWDEGTTEGGSSGSPLFDQNHRVIGQLGGGGAACGNNKSDWYGKFSVSWVGGGTDDTRLSDWLDPDGTNETTTNTLIGPSAAPTVSPRPTPSPTTMADCVAAGKQTLQVDVLTDRYPEETTYTLVNICTGLTEASRDFTSLYTLEETQFSDVHCVTADAKFTFTIYDSEDDGICCSFGDGDYSVTYDGSVVATGGEFGSSESTTFGTCVVGTPSPTKSPTIAPSASPSKTPSSSPTGQPSEAPTKAPTKESSTPSPTVSPTSQPTSSPSKAPTASPTGTPTAPPTRGPVQDAGCSAINGLPLNTNMKRQECRATQGCTWVNGQGCFPA